MATITASQASRTGAVEPRWLKWFSIGFLGLNILLLILAFVLWRARHTANLAVERQPVAASASTVEEENSVAVDAQPAAGASLQSDAAISAPAAEEADAASSTVETPLEMASVAVDGIFEEKLLLRRHTSQAALAPPTSLHRRGDLDRDGDVDIYDVVRYARNPDGTDVNGDGIADVRDLITLDIHYGMKDQAIKAR